MNVASTPVELPRVSGRPSLLPSRRHVLASRLHESTIAAVLFFCAACSVLTTGAIVLSLFVEAFHFFQRVSIVDFLTDTQWTPLFADKHFGVMPLLCGTLVTSAIALGVALPAGLLCSIYLSEFSSARLRRWLKPILEILAGIPTIVYGYFALLVVTPLLQLIVPGLAGFNALSPGIVMGVMILPTVASLSEDAIYSVPLSLRQGSYALGATRLQTVFGVTVPAAFGGIIASCILAVSRAIGETMIVTIAAGQQPIFTLNPLQGMETMTAYIVQVSLGDTPHGTLEYQTLFAVATMLFVMTLVLNMISIRLRRRFRSW